MRGEPSTPLPVVLATSNGVGMGHLTRQLTVALGAREHLDPVLFSLSGALPTVRTAVAEGRLPELSGVRTEYCPSRRSGWLPKGGPALRLRRLYPAYNWEPYFADRICALVAETGARVVLFDGVVPYAGLRAARERLPGTAFVWMRRGMWGAGTGEKWLTHSGLFDLVIEPGDFAGAGDRGPTAARDDATRVAPISIREALTLHDRARARRALGLDPDRPALLLTPGTGALEDVAAPVRVALEVVRRHAPHWQVAVTSPALARHGIVADGNDVVLLTDTYPLARSLAAFDAAVSAAGYNSVHELLGAGVPTVLVPGQAVGTDDQPGRAATLAGAGACLAVDPADAEGMRRAVTCVLDPAAAAELSAACRDLPPATGGAQTARLVVDLAAGREPPAGIAAAGPWGPPVWRRALPDPRTPVDLGTDPRSRPPHRGSRPLHVTEQLPPHRIGPDPLEHLVEGSSAAYRSARLDIARWLYRPAGR